MRAQDLISRYIEEDPRYPGPNEARIIGYGVSVWALVGYLRTADGDVERVAADYDLPVEAVEAALAYYRRHKAAIDAQITSNTPSAA